MEWDIYGEKGAIRVTAPGPFLFLSLGLDSMKIQIQDGEGYKAEEVEIPGDEFSGYEHRARDVAWVYKELAEGAINCSFEDAVERHELIDGIYKENGIEA
jgi:predicted dehydrogenase